jgi:toxin ParE1/3/4
MKKYKVLFDFDAEDDLFEIFTAAEEERSMERAQALIASLQNLCRTLATTPMRGHVPPELLEIGVIEFREIHYEVYRIIYSIESRSVYVHCILDGRRDIETLLHERFFRQSPGN